MFDNQCEDTVGNSRVPQSVEDLPEQYREIDEDERHERIEAARDELGDEVVILGHNYQQREIIDHADFVGDSFQLSKQASTSDARYVIFAGVTFMAESAEVITDSDQQVILPNLEATCPMAGMAERSQVEEVFEALQTEIDGDLIPICYMNSYADLKAFTGEHGGVVCTSSNAEDAFEWAFDRGEAVLFLPDRNLGINTANRLGRDDTAVIDPYDGPLPAETVANTDVFVWDGYCQVHERFRPREVKRVREDNPDVTVMVHPECRESVVERADRIGSTAGIIQAIENSDPGEGWAIGTEVHLIRQLQRTHPDVDIEVLGEATDRDCLAMGKIDPNGLLWVLEELRDGRAYNVIDVESGVAENAQLALDRMLQL